MFEPNIRKYAGIRYIFLLWKLQTQQKIEKKKSHAVADKVHQQLTYNETWQIWNQHKEQKKKLKLMKRQAKGIYVFSTLKQNLEAWRRQCDHVRLCRVKSKQLQVLRQKKQVTFYFGVWKSITNDYHKRTNRITKLKKLRKNISCRKILLRWKSVLDESIRQKGLILKTLAMKRKITLNVWYREFNLTRYKYRKINKLVEKRNSNLSGACFERWKTYLIIHFQNELKIRHLSVHLKKVSLRHYFILWRHWEQAKHLERQARARKEEEVNKIFVSKLFEVICDMLCLIAHRQGIHRKTFLYVRK